MHRINANIEKPTCGESLIQQVAQSSIASAQSAAHIARMTERLSGGIWTTDGDEIVRAKRKPKEAI